VANFIIDREMVCVAAEELQLLGTVKIYTHGRKGPNDGLHRPTFTDGWHHSIMVKSYLKPAYASLVLWHEMTHARQVEEINDVEAFVLQYKQENRTVGYAKNRFEVEANQMAQRMRHLRLVKKAR
jgi:hypothetical protein